MLHLERQQFEARENILIAEFDGFDTPVCEYLKPSRINQQGFEQELLEAASGQKIVSCTNEDGIQRAEILSKDGRTINRLNFLWPQLTGKLRVS